MKAQELLDKYESDLKQLQEVCKHEDVTDFIDEWWAPAHSTGAKVKTCNICWKTIERIAPKWEDWTLQTNTES